MIKAKNALIAWNGVNDNEDGAPAGAVAVGPILQEHALDWTHGYASTGGATLVMRRTLTGLSQQFHVICDWYQLVYGYGLHPFVVHTAFLHIEEYQAIIKEMGMGPDRGELGHDPSFGYGRAVGYPLPEIRVKCIGPSFHVWPEP